MSSSIFMVAETSAPASIFCAVSGFNLYSDASIRELRTFVRGNFLLPDDFLVLERSKTNEQVVKRHSSTEKSSFSHVSEDWLIYIRVPLTCHYARHRLAAPSELLSSEGST